MTASAHGKSDTAARILEVAAHLFGTRGFSATSTRDIASAVGIKQPGLYKHFSSKDDILVALCRWAIEWPSAVAEALTRLQVPAAPGLYRFLHETCHHLHRSPYVLASLLRTPEVYQPAFQEWLDANHAADRLITWLVQRGVDDGVFRPMRVESAPRLVLGLVETLATPLLPVPDRGDVDDVIEFTFAALLADRRQLSRVRRAALSLEIQSALPASWRG